MGSGAVMGLEDYGEDRIQGRRSENYAEDGIQGRGYENCGNVISQD
jgi:hypothetical protein